MFNFKKESDLAKVVIDYFENEGYDTYKEVVNSNRGNNRADIILVKNGEYTVIETKLSFGIGLIDQCFRWKLFSNNVYGCVPKPKRRKRKFGYDICRDYGIGIIEVDKYGKVNIIQESSYNKHPELPKLYEEQKTQEPGVRASVDSYITPFKITIKKLIKFVSESKDTNINLSSAMDNIEHHYSNNRSAKNAISKLIKIGVIKDLVTYKVNNKMCVKLNS